MEPEKYSKEMPLTFPVIKKSKRKITLVQGVIIAMMGFLFLYVIIVKTYYKYDIAADSRSAILFVLLIIAVFVINFMMQKFRFGGEFTITDKEIILNTTNKTFTFPINEITNLKMLCCTTGEKTKTLTVINKWLFGKAEGCSNYVKFNHNGKDYQMELYLKGKEEVELFVLRAKDLNQS